MTDDARNNGDPNRTAAGDPVGNGDGRTLTTLAELPEGALLDETALAAALRVSRRTVRRMVGRYEIPPPVRLAGRSTWKAGAVLRWIEAEANRRAREAKRAAEKLRRILP